MGNKFFQTTEASSGDVYIQFDCPGCGEFHHLPVQSKNVPGKCWGFNGNLESPTLTPSILARGKRKMTDDEYKRILANEKVHIPDMVCHSFVRDGKIQFLNDCTHDLKGQTVELPDYFIPNDLALSSKKF